MGWDQRLREVLLFQAGVMVVVVATILFSSPSDERLFEVFGALLSASITVFGIREMRKLTA
ncbi:MAG: hypothetical protein ABEJ75_01445 [Candidatus Nanohaloarchaea archaeon]